MIDPGTPFTARELAVALDQVVHEGTAQLSGLADEAFFAPQGTAWSPAEHVRHLRKSTAPILQAMRIPRVILWFRFGMHRGRSRSYDTVVDTYLLALSRGGGAGRFAPSVERMPGNKALRRREIMEAWQASLDGIVRELPRWSEAALDRGQLPHPLLGKLSLREMLAFTVYHTVHHLHRVAERAGQDAPDGDRAA